MANVRLVIIEGQEGAGKSTTVRALAPEIAWSARIDAEDLGDVNPWQMDDAFLELLWRNIADLTRNYWSAGYSTVIAGSFLSNIGHYTAFRALLDDPADIYMVQLCATKPVRDVRRIERPKESTQEWHDHVDLVDPEDTTLAVADSDYRFLRIDNEGFGVDESVARIRAWAPELFA
jgi:hypothetical protein